MYESQFYQRFTNRRDQRWNKSLSVSHTTLSYLDAAVWTLELKGVYFVSEQWALVISKLIHICQVIYTFKAHPVHMWAVNCCCCCVCDFSSINTLLKFKHWLNQRQTKEESLNSLFHTAGYRLMCVLHYY